MKIIGVSNFDSESVSDILVCTGLDEKAGYGTLIINHLNNDENNSYYYKLVHDDYVLYEFKP